MSILKWISDWFSYHCDSEWEREYGFKIVTMADPGFMVEINLTETILEDLEINEVSVVVDKDDDWYQYKIENQTFIGMCDPTKLEFILTCFKNLVEENGGYHYNKSSDSIIYKYGSKWGCVSTHSVSVPYHKLYACIQEFEENMIDIEKIEVAEFKKETDYQGQS